jgi:protein-S-isoprenylcysteine O-methyltransferase Ste14
MLVRFVPLALLVLFHVLVALRNEIHKQRTGKSGNYLHRGRTRFERVRAFGFRLLLGLAWVQTIRAALGSLELAPTPLLRALGGGLALGGALLMFAAQLDLGNSWRIGIEPGARPGLVEVGMYRWTRNPIFLWMLVSWIGLALLVFDLLLGFGVLLLIVGVRAQVLEEEEWLSETYGESYREYAARVGRFVPWIGRLAQDRGSGAS